MKDCQECIKAKDIISSFKHSSVWNNKQFVCQEYYKKHLLVNHTVYFLDFVW